MHTHEKTSIAGMDKKIFSRKNPSGHPRRTSVVNVVSNSKGVKNLFQKA